MTTMQAIERVMKNRDEWKVSPGQPASFTEACTVNDCIAQGDLNLVILDDVPNDYIEVVDLEEKHRQLVPGNNEGAKHCLEHLRGIRLFYPPNWNMDSLVGPVMLISRDNTVLHPTHGNVHIPAGFTVGTFYQREWDRELEKERRARD